MKLNYLIQKSIKLNSKINDNSKQFRHFSFILDGNKVISIGQNNKDKTHPLAFKSGYKYSCIHSELDALVRTKINPNKFKQCIIVNVRLNRFNNINLSRPCIHCQNLIKNYKFKKCFYTNENGFFEEYKF